MKKIENVMRRMSVLVLCLVALSACQKGNNKNSDEETSGETSSITVDQVLSTPDDYIGQTITLQGVCTHICKHGGCKLFLMGSDDDHTIRVDAGEAIGSFPTDVVNNLVEIEGKLVEERIDEAYLAKWESELKEELSKEHGNENESGCAADMKANSEAMANSVAERIANFRARIAERSEREGKAYVSIYHVEADRYKVL